MGFFFHVRILWDIGHFNFCMLLFVCDLANTSVGKAKYSLKGQKKISLVVAVRFLDGVLGLAVGFGKCLSCCRLLEEYGK